MKQEETFFEDEGNGWNAFGGLVLEGVFLPGSQSCYKGRNLFRQAYTISFKAVRSRLCFDNGMDDIPLDGNVLFLK